MEDHPRVRKKPSFVKVNRNCRMYIENIVTDCKANVKANKRKCCAKASLNGP